MESPFNPTGIFSFIACASVGVITFNLMLAARTRSYGRASRYLTALIVVLPWAVGLPLFLHFLAPGAGIEPILLDPVMVVRDTTVVFGFAVLGGAVVPVTRKPRRGLMHKPRPPRST